MLSHAIIFRALACFEHSNLLKVTSSSPRAQREAAPRVVDSKAGLSDATCEGDQIRRGPKSNYELFNCNNLNIRYWSWNYRGCWHQTCPPIDTHKEI